MNHLARTLLLLTILTVMSSGVSTAQGADPSKCYTRALMSIEESSRDARSALTILDMVESSNFELAKHQFSSEFSYAGIDAGGSYDDFKSRLEQLKKTYSFSSSSSDVNGARRQFFSEGALATIDKCIAGVLANGSIGLNYDVFSPDPDTVYLTVYYKPGPGGGEISVDSTSLTNGLVADAKPGQLLPQPARFLVNSSKTVAIRREKSAVVVSGNINAGPYSMAFSAAPSAPIVTPPPTGSIVQKVVRPLTVATLCETENDSPCAMGAAAITPLLANSTFMVIAAVHCELKTGLTPGGNDPHLNARIVLKRRDVDLSSSSVWCSYCANRRHDHPNAPKPVTDQLWAPFVVRADDAPGVAGGVLVTYDLLGYTRTGTRLECMNKAGAQKGIFSPEGFGLVTLMEVAR
jgi:hypothetical protein